MVATLIKKILLQADTPDTKLEQMPDLNTLLKSDCSRNLRNLFAVSGGLGSTYKAIQPFLTVTSDGIITAINEEQIIKLGQTLLREGDGKPAYKAGICFALVAVYANDIPQKLAAYKALVDLFDEDGALDNREMYSRCLGFLRPNPLNNQFYPLNKIIWTWEIKGKQDVLSFETQRHALLLGTNSKFTIEQALLLLGLEIDNLDEEKITTASSLCRAKLKSLAGLNLQETRSNPIFNNYKEAESILLHYMKFKKFNYQKKFQPLTEMLAKIQKTEMTDDIIFNDAYRLFTGLDSELRAAIKIFDLEPSFSTYIDYSMIQTQLGGHGYSAKFIAEEQLKLHAQNYWKSICNKVDPLISDADALAYSPKITAKSINSIKEHCTKIEKAIGVLTQIIGSALEETSVISTAATNAEAKKNALSDKLEILKRKVAQYDEDIKNTVNGIVLLNQEVAKAETNTSRVITIDFFREERVKIEKINKNLLWLRSLDTGAKSIASTEFRTHIVSQATLEDVINAVTAELNKIAKPVRDKALKAFLGSQYNQVVPLELTVKRFFESKKDQNLQTLVASFLGEIKGLIREQQDIVVDITVKDLIPEPTYMTFDLAIQKLEENKAKINTSIEKANEELSQLIQSLMQDYAALTPEIDVILQDKNSLAYSWQKTMAKFLQKQHKLNEEMSNFHKKIPADFRTADYMDPSVVTLINQLHQQQSQFDKKATAMKNQVGKASLDALNYTLLKNHIKQERKAYIAQGKHAQARFDSLERLSYAIEGIDSNNSDNRFALLVAEVKKEQDKTALSHQNIGFLGHYRSSRLEKMYATIIDESKNLTVFSPANGSWDNAKFSLDIVKYMKLKDHITKESLSYLKYGTHHKDRHDSLARLAQMIKELDGQDSKKDNRFATLFAALQNEETATIKSHLKVGFFGNWHSCRLQKVYGKILLEATRLNEISIPTTEEQLSHDVTSVVC